MRKHLIREGVLCVLAGALVSCMDGPTIPAEPGPGVLSEAASAAGPNEATLYGPETFIRGRGQPVLEIREVEVGGIAAPFTLHVRNGDAAGRNRVSSARISVDGQPVLGPSDFSPRVAGHTVPIELGGVAVLTVQLEGAPGSELTLWIDGIDPMDMTFITVWTAPDGVTIERSHRAVAGEATAIDADDAPGTDLIAVIDYGADEVGFLVERAPGNEEPFPVTIEAVRDGSAGDDRVFRLAAADLPDALRLDIEDLPAEMTFTVATDASTVGYSATAPFERLSIDLAASFPVLHRATHLKAWVLDAPAELSLAVSDADPFAAVQASADVGQLLMAASQGPTGLSLPNLLPGDSHSNDFLSVADKPAEFELAMRMSAVEQLSVNLDPLAISLVQDPAHTRPIDLTAEIDPGLDPLAMEVHIDKPGASTVISTQIQPGMPVQLDFDNSGNLHRFTLKATRVANLGSAELFFDNVSRRLSVCMDAGPACQRPNPNPIPGFSSVNNRPYAAEVSIDLDDFGTHGSGSGASFPTSLNGELHLFEGDLIEITGLQFHNVSLDIGLGPAFSGSCTGGQQLPRMYVFVDSRSHPFSLDRLRHPERVVDYRIGTHTNPARAANRVAALRGCTGFLNSTLDRLQAGGMTCGGQAALYTELTVADAANILNYPTLGSSLVNLCGGTVPNPQPW